MASKKRRRPSRPATAPAFAAPSVEEAPAKPAPARRRLALDPASDARDVPWTGRGLLALLALSFLLQIPVGAIIHFTSHTNPLIIDLFFFQPQYLVIACVVVMPLARRLTGQARNLRLLETLSIGVMYALLSLTLGTFFVHPATAAQSTDQFIRNLKLSDGLLIALSDVIALFGTVALYPGFSRLLGAPARRARRRMLERTAAGTSRPATGRAAASKQASRSAAAKNRPRR